MLTQVNGAYVRHCNNCDQTDATNENNHVQISLEKLYNMLQDTKPEEIDVYLIEAALKIIGQEIKPKRHSTSSFYNLTAQLSPKELLTANQDFDAIASNVR